jgi:hypothetical protein
MEPDARQFCLADQYLEPVGVRLGVHGFANLVDHAVLLAAGAADRGVRRLGRLGFLPLA